MVENQNTKLLRRRQVSQRCNMPHLERHIKDERLSAEEYRRLAGRDAGEAKKFRRIAKDEERHADTLEEIEMKEEDC